MAKDAKADLLLALSPKGGDSAPSEKGEDYGDSASDVLSAIKDNDAASFKTALRTFVMECMGDEESEPESER